MISLLQGEAGLEAGMRSMREFSVLVAFVLVSVGSIFGAELKPSQAELQKLSEAYLAKKPASGGIPARERINTDNETASSGERRLKPRRSAKDNSP